MLASELPATAVLVSPGVWADAPSRTRFYSDPSDATLLLTRAWTSVEVTTYTDAQNALATSHAALKAVIGGRVAALRTALTASTALATAETDRAALVTGLPLAQVTPAAIQGDLALLHTDMAKAADGLSLALAGIADLADYVSSTL